MITSRRRLGWLTFCVVLCATPCHAQRVLWQVGLNDGAYADLAIAGNYGAFSSRFPADPVFRVGRSDPSTGWPFVHPGPADAWAGSREHVFRTEFALAREPVGVCRLTVGCVNTHYGSPPVLRIVVNGAIYRFSLPAGASDASLTDPRVGRPYTLRLPLPASRLSRGANVIDIVTEAGSWLLYDYVLLEDEVDMPAAPVVADLRCECTMLFRKTRPGLRQVVRIQLTNNGLEGPATVTLAGDVSARAAQTLLPGPNTILVDVPPIRRQGTAMVAVDAGGHASRFEVACHPQRRWTVFVAPSAHTDIGYTDLQEHAIRRHVDNTVAALSASASDPSFRWNLEVAHQFAALQGHRPDLAAHLVQALRSGRLDCQAAYLNMLTGLCSSEEMVRVFELAGEVRRLAPSAARTASITDVPTVVGTMPTILRSAGIRYFTDAVNEYRAPVFGPADPRMRQAPFWWEGPDGSRVLTIFTGGYAQGSALGLTQSVSTVLERLPGWLRGFERPDYPCDSVLAYGAFSDNEAIRPVYARVATEWNRQWAYPRIRICRTTDFFEHVERTSGTRLPVFRGDMGVYWEDGAGSSAYETSLARYARGRIESAERTLALESLLLGRPFPRYAVRDAWQSVLFANEHTWGAWCSVSDPNAEATRGQWMRKAAFSRDAARKAKELDAPEDHGAPIAAPARLLVRNSLPWTRDIPVSRGLAESRDVMVIDTRDGRSVDSAVEQSGRPRLVFTALAVRGMSEAEFEVRHGSCRAEPLLREGPDQLSWRTESVALRLDPVTGAIASLRTGPERREWVDTGRDGGLNDFIYVSGGEGSSIVQPGAPAPLLREHRHSVITTEMIANGPDRAIIRVQRRGKGLPAVDTFYVVRRDGRIEMRNIVRKEFTTAREGAYFAFPFALRDREHARALVDVPFGIVEADRGQMPAACREWYTAQSVVAVTDGQATATLATPHAPLLTLGGIFRGAWRAAKAIDGRVLSYVMNNYWDTNYRAGQAGTLTFCYALDLRDGPPDPNGVLRFGQEQIARMSDPGRVSSDAPPLDDEDLALIRSDASRPSAAALEVTGAAVTGMTHNDRGLLIRLLNAAAQPTAARVALPTGRFRAWMTDLYGFNPKPIRIDTRGRIHVLLRAGSIQTVLIGRASDPARLLLDPDTDVAR